MGSTPRWPSGAGSSPAASSSDCGWPGRCWPTRRCWCWSSRPARSTRTPRPASPPGWVPPAQGRTTVVCTTSPLVLDRADHVHLRRGRSGGGRGHPPRAADAASGLRRDGDPRGGRMSARIVLPVPPAPRYAATRVACSVGIPRAMGGALALHGIAAVAGSGHALADRPAGRRDPARHDHDRRWTRSSWPSSASSWSSRC